MGLQVIGAGLGRTGTASLKVALEQLGFGRCYHMGEVLGNLDAVPLWIEAGKGRPDWDTLLAGYGAAVDYPSCSFWREQLAHFPEAKVVVSTRDAEGWFDSVHATIMAPDATAWLRQGPLREFFELCVWRDFEPHIFDRDYMVAYYRQRIEAIRDAVPAERLLIFDVREGWEPLCEFLGVPVPATPFPRVNSRDETRKLLDLMIAAQQGDGVQDVMRKERGRLFRGDVRLIRAQSRSAAADPGRPLRAPRCRAARRSAPLAVQPSPTWAAATESLPFFLPRTRPPSSHSFEASCMNRYSVASQTAKCVAQAISTRTLLGAAVRSA